MSSRFVPPAAGSTGPGAALPARTRLDAYEVEALVAHSGFAFVYRAVHPATQQVVAIKEYFPEAIALRHATHQVTPRSSSGRQRFEDGRRAFVDEARALSRFDHAALVRVLGLFEANGTAYRVMRFTPGPTLLAHRLALGRIPAIEDLGRWVDGLLDALATLHHAGCAHGAVAPANVLLRPGERPLLLGFDAVPQALAPARRPDSFQALDEARSPPERPAPPAPFPARAAADLLSLAATLRYCIEGGAQATSLAEAWRREGGPVPIPQHIVRLLDAIDACLCGDPDGRPRSVDEFRRRLDESDPAAPRRVAAAAMPPDEARNAPAPDAPAPDASAGSDCAAGVSPDTRSERLPVEEPGIEREPSPDAAILPPEQPEPGCAASPEPVDTAELDDQAAADDPAESDVEADVATRAEAGPEPNALAGLAATVEIEEAPRPDAAHSAPTTTLGELPRAPPMPGSDAAASATGDSGVRPPGGDRRAAVCEVVATRGETVPKRWARPRHAAVAVAVTASVVLAIAMTVRGGREVEPHLPARPAPPTESQAAVTRPADPAGPAPLPAAAPTPVAMATHEAESRPAVIMSPPAESPPSHAAPKPPRSSQVARPPATARKVAAATTPTRAPARAPARAPTRTPNEVCEGRKGFALYQCMQLQCAKAASTDHADCASLR